MKSDLQKANAELIMQRFREAMAAGDAAATLQADRPAVTREVFEAMQQSSPNIELHRVTSVKSVRGLDQ